MDRISNFKSTTKKDHIHEEKVLHFTDRVVSHETSTQKSEQSVVSEPTSSKVVKEGLIRSSKVLDEGKEELDRYLANEINSKRVSRRIVEDEVFEHNNNQSLPLTAFQALKFQGRTKHFVGSRSIRKNDDKPLKTSEVKIASLASQNFHLAESKRSTEAKRTDKLLLLQSERGNKGTKLQPNRSEISDLSSLSLPLPARNKKKISGAKENEKATQRNMEKNNEKLKMIVNNLVSAVSYSFQNALALQEQRSQEIDNSFLAFFLRREVRKMYLIKELIEELKAITIRFKFHEVDFKDISETVESLHCLMRKDLKDPSSEEIPQENRKYYPGVIALLAITGRIMAVIGLAVAFFDKWSGLLAFIFFVLMFFLVIRHFVT